MTPDEMRKAIDAARAAALRRGVEPDLRILPPNVLAAVVLTDRGVEIPLFGKGWGPLAVHHTLAEIEALPELEPGSRRV